MQVVPKTHFGREEEIGPEDEIRPHDHIRHSGSRCAEFGLQGLSASNLGFRNTLGVRVKACWTGLPGI